MKVRKFGVAAIALTSSIFAACGSSTSDDPGSGGPAGSGGQSGASGSGGNAGADAGSGCPANFTAAEGTACAQEGKSCNSPGCSDPCQHCNILRCESGKWVRMESFPAPNCGDSGKSDAADGGSSDSGGADASDSGASDASSDAADGGGKACGGKKGLTCSKDEYCDFANNCGAGDALGVCKKRPQGCTADCPGVCGCDGKFYCNACGAAAAGIDVTGDDSCKKDGGGPGTACKLHTECNTGLKCCYPCGQAGCQNQCMQPMPNGQCPAFP